MQVDCVLDARAVLGEGAVWCEREQVLWWADIEAKALHRFDPAKGDDRVRHLPSRIGCFALREQGGMVVALENGFHFLDLATGALEAIVDPEADKCQLAGNKTWLFDIGAALQANSATEVTYSVPTGVH